MLSSDPFFFPLSLSLCLSLLLLVKWLEAENENNLSRAKRSFLSFLGYVTLSVVCP